MIDITDKVLHIGDYYVNINNTRSFSFIKDNFGKIIMCHKSTMKMFDIEEGNKELFSALTTAINDSKSRIEELSLKSSETVDKDELKKIALEIKSLTAEIATMEEQIKINYGNQVIFKDTSTNTTYEFTSDVFAEFLTDIIQH